MTRRLALTIPLFVALLSGTAPSAQEAPAKPAGPAKPKDEKVEVVEEVVRKPTAPAKAQGLDKAGAHRGSGQGSARSKRASRVHAHRPADRRANDEQDRDADDGNRQWGRLRSQITSRIYGGAPLNVDAGRPSADGRINLELTIDYSQVRNAKAKRNADKIQVIRINQSLTAIARKRQVAARDAIRRPRQRPESHGGGEGDGVEIGAWFHGFMGPWTHGPASTVPATLPRCQAAARCSP